MFKKAAITLCVGIVTVLAASTPAQAQGTTLRAAFSLINFEEGFTPKGLNVDFAKEMTTSGNMGVDLVVEGGFNKIEDFNFVNVGGGARVRVPAGTQVTISGQGVIGLVHDNSGFEANNLYTAIGGAAHFNVNENTALFVQLDLMSVYFEGATDSGPRVLLGVAMRR